MTLRGDEGSFLPSSASNNEGLRRVEAKVLYSRTYVES